MGYMCRRFRLMAFIVDHGLREESAEEANRAVTWAKEMGLSPVLIRLQWMQQPIKTKLLEEARRLRYLQLLEKCHQHGITTLLIGHHAGNP